jgi:ParB family chromosome partitioning protein
MTTPREPKTMPESEVRNAAERANEERTSRLIRILPIASITPDPNNRPIDEDDDDFIALVDSIRVLGVLDPVQVRMESDRFLLVDGERRWRAARKAGLVELPCYVWAASVTSRETLIAGVVLNEQRQPHSCIHVARRLRELKITNGLTGEQVAAATGLSLDRVKTYLCLFNGSEFLLEFFAKHDVSLTIAAELIRYEKATNEARARALALRHLEVPLSREELVRRRKQDSESSQKKDPAGSAKTIRTSSLGRSLERAWSRDPRAARMELETVLSTMGFRLVPLDEAEATVG